MKSKNISIKLLEIEIIPYETLLFFDEMRECVSTSTYLKSFREDGRFDVICSGSLMRINYKDIKYGIKICNKNIGFNGKLYIFPYFLPFLLKRYLKDRISSSEK